MKTKLIKVNWSQFYKLVKEDRIGEFWKEYRAIDKRARKYWNEKINEKRAKEKLAKMKELKDLPVDLFVYYTGSGTKELIGTGGKKYKDGRKYMQVYFGTILWSIPYDHLSKIPLSAEHLKHKKLEYKMNQVFKNIKL